MSDLKDRIERLKKRRKAVILAHNYQPPEVQDIADEVGDSLELGRKSAELTDREVVVFCGVRFMAETSSILCPGKKVVMPDPRAGCPMADMIDAAGLRKLKNAHPDAVVVAYVNTPAEVKAESDICCTSANAVQVVRSIARDREILFVPDRNLGMYVAAQTGRPMICWDGFCPVHAGLAPGDVEDMRKRHPRAEVVVHPECPPEVIRAAGRALSTGGLCRYAKESLSTEFIVGSETGILHRMRKENPGKEFHPLSESAVCRDMKLTSPGKILTVLEDLNDEVRIPDTVRQKALSAIVAMLRIG